MKLFILLIIISTSIGAAYSQFQFDESPTRFKGHRTSVNDVELVLMVKNWLPAEERIKL